MIALFFLNNRNAGAGASKDLQLSTGETWPLNRSWPVNNTGTLAPGRSKDQQPFPAKGNGGGAAVACHRALLGKLVPT